jgi:periplasmic copper chaperone A
MPPKENTIFRTVQVLLVFLFLGGTACSPGEPQILIKESEAILSPAILGVASVFVKIVNSGNGGDRLLSAHTDVPGAVTELHDERDGKMTTVASMDVPANSTLVLRPGGKHIMILRIPRSMKAGAELRVVLNFKRAGEKEFKVKLIEYATMAPRARYH